MFSAPAHIPRKYTLNNCTHGKESVECRRNQRSSITILCFPLSSVRTRLKAAAEPDIHFLSLMSGSAYAAACSNGVRQKGHFIKIDGGFAWVESVSFL